MDTNLIQYYTHNNNNQSINPYNILYIQCIYIYIYISKAIGSTIFSILQGFRGISPWKYGWFIAAILSTATGSHVCQHVCFQACTVLLEPESAAENAKFNYGIVQNQTLGILRPSPEILDATGWSLHLSHLSVHCSTWEVPHVQHALDEISWSLFRLNWYKKKPKEFFLLDAHPSISHLCKCFSMVFKYRKPSIQPNLQLQGYEPFFWVQ